MVIALEEFKDDWNWQAAIHEAVCGYYTSSYLEENPEHPIHNVAEVLAADAGEHDERDWIAILRMKDGQWAMLRAGCDYTGWDCRAGGSMEYFETVDEACSAMSLTPEELKRLAPDLAVAAQEGRVCLTTKEPEDGKR